MQIKEIDRAAEARGLRACLRAKRPVILEGPVGVGKTRLALGVLKEWGRPIWRIDGDPRYSEQKVIGTFDPAAVMQKGYQWETFLAGPLVEALQQGGALFINELNRLPEGTQNTLLPVLDEGILSLPKLGKVQAAEGFCVVATQNPSDFVATTRLSEALLDRFEVLKLTYPSFEAELKVVESHLGEPLSELDRVLARRAVELVRKTRQEAGIRRGASLRAGVSIALLTRALQAEGSSFQEAFDQAVLFSLASRVEWEPSFEEGQVSLAEQQEKKLREFCGAMAGDEKKKPLRERQT